MMHPRSANVVAGFGTPGSSRKPSVRHECGRVNSAFRCADSANPAARGFTLIEIMIVIGIAAIIMATGLPAFTRNARRETLNQAVSDVFEACGTARDRAILQDSAMEVVFRASDGHIAVRPAKLEADGEAVTGGAPEIVAPEEADAGEIKGFNFDREIMILMMDVNMVDHMQAPTARVRFYPNGTSDELTLILQSPRGGVRKISLEVVTALADMEEIR